jgi:tripartite-type tricarboxylate transporter receptor subunit TctC
MMLRTRVRGALLLLLGLVASTIAVSARAEDYPTRPVTVFVPLAAGTGMDVIVRLYSDGLSKSLGKPFVVENRPGAFQMLAVNAVLPAAPDGYSLVAMTSAGASINASMLKNVTYDTNRDFVPLSLYVKSPFILVVDPALPIHSVRELIKYAKEHPGQLSYSSSGTGGVPHLVFEMLKQRFGLDITHVPYKNSPQSISDIAAGHVNMAFAEAGASVPLIKDGKLRALAVSSAVRLPTIPDVPPFREVSDDPEFEAVSWHALFTRAGTPEPIVTKLHDEMARIMSEPEIQEKITTLGLIPLNPPSIADTQAYVASETKKWGALVKTLGLEATQ